VADATKMREALEKIADMQGSYGPFPEANSPEWRAMAIVTAREAIAEQPAQGEVVAWRAVAEHNDPVTGVWIESDDFAHDVRLYVNGDFADQGQRLAYAKRIADCLMNDWDEGWMQGWDDCRAGTPTPNRIR